MHKQRRNVVHYNRLKPSKASAWSANCTHQLRQSTQLDNNTQNIDPELNSTGDSPASDNESDWSSVLMLPPHPIINLTDDIDSGLTV